MPLSPIELLLPNGFTNRAIVLGDNCPSILAPASSARAEAGGVDLVVLAPTASERRDPAWVESAVGTTVSRLSSDGIAYVIPSRAVGLRRALEAGGLHDAGLVLHIPDPARTRHVVPLGTAAARYALSGQLPANRFKRAVAHAGSRSRLLSQLGPTSALLRRDPAIPLAGWLFELDGTARPTGSALVTASSAAVGGHIVHRFPAGSATPDAVAKISPRAHEERDALRGEPAAAAARTGARVPREMGSGELGSVPFMLQSALGGRSAALLIERKRLSPDRLQERIVTWLEQWGRSSMHRRELTPSDLERFVLAPAIELASAEGLYLDYLKQLCARAEGMICPFVPSHGDLTAANLLLEEHGELGVVDWEDAREDSLPLMDFFYAAADAVAAVKGYTDRPGAVVACFSSAGAKAPVAAGLQRRLARALGVNETLQDVCFHACWLQHAANEARRPGRLDAGPFATILRTIARDPQDFRLLNQGR